MAMADPRAAISSFVAGHRDEAVRFLAELVRTPSDNPPGDCAPHAARAAALLDLHRATDVVALSLYDLLSPYA
jgi:hypothetical protein